MIDMLYTLNKKYDPKQIYIWDINRDSVAVFSYLAFRRINISGFVVKNQEFVGYNFMHRKIVNIQYLNEKKDILLIMSDHCRLSDAERQMLSDEIEVIPYAKALALNEQLKNKRLVIYGTGKMGDQVFRSFKGEDIQIEAFCVSEHGKEGFFHNIPVTVFDHIKNKEQCSVILAVKNEEYKSQILDKLNCSNVEQIFVDEIVEPYFDQEVFFQAINEAIVKHKKIYMYGCRNGISNLLESVFAVYDINIDGYVGDAESAEQNINNVFDLCYVDISNVLVIINENCSVKLQRMCETLDKIGLSLEDFNYTSLKRTAVDYKYADYHVLDTLVGTGLQVDADFPGFFVYGNNHEKDIRILVLGGSTSADGVYRPQCWSRYLYEICLKERYRATIFNCAYPGHDVVQELLHLLRDGFALKPDIVVSMSGVNNIIDKEKVENQFNVEYFMDLIRGMDPRCKVISGIKTEETLFEFWLRTEKIMKAVSEIYGAVFYGFLQPMRCAKKEKDLFETSVFQTEKSQKSLKQFRQYVDCDQTIINLISRFNNNDGMFIDFCHYSNQGNQLLAEVVFSYLLGDIVKIASVKEK